MWRNANADRLLDSSVFGRADVTIYLFHMPLFFFLSGLFVTAQVARGGQLGYLATRPKSILLPLLVWSIATAAFRIVAGQHLTTADIVRADRSRQHLLVPLGVARCQQAAVMIRVLPRPRAATLVAAVAVLPVCYASLAYRTVENLPFYLLGMLIPVVAIPVAWTTGLVGLAASPCCLPRRRE